MAWPADGIDGAALFQAPYYILIVPSSMMWIMISKSVLIKGFKHDNLERRPNIYESPLARFGMIYGFLMSFRQV